MPVCVQDRAAQARSIAEASPYHGTGRASRPAGLAAMALACLFGLSAGACSMSIPLGSMFGDKGGESEVIAKGDTREATGSLPLQAAKAEKPSDTMTSVDWTLATVALREALARPEDGASIPWQNPTTGARGTVTPVATAYTQDGFPCRNFLASHVGGSNETWFEGAACRIHRGQWDIRSTRPLKKS